MSIAMPTVTYLATIHQKYNSSVDYKTERNRSGFRFSAALKSSHSPCPKRLHGRLIDA
jgi:hypothetical protein